MPLTPIFSPSGRRVSLAALSYRIESGYLASLWLLALPRNRKSARGHLASTLANLSSAVLTRPARGHLSATTRGLHTPPPSPSYHLHQSSRLFLRIYSNLLCIPLSNLSLTRSAHFSRGSPTDHLLARPILYSCARGEKDEEIFTEDYIGKKKSLIFF